MVTIRQDGSRLQVTRDSVAGVLGPRLAQSAIDSTKIYKVATTRYGVSRLRDEVGPVDAPQPRGMLRDLTIDHIKRHGLTQLRA